MWFFTCIFIIYRVTEYIAKNIGFLCLILATGCYSSETNAIVPLQYVKHFSVSLSICDVLQETSIYVWN